MSFVRARVQPADEARNAQRAHVDPSASAARYFETRGNDLSTHESCGSANPSDRTFNPLPRAPETGIQS